jgi:spore germination cell wall hydrolase CwlJ-like protein
MSLRSAPSQDPIDVLARTLWGEARGEGQRGMEAVACVILNRAANPRWWGRDIVSVCLAPWQFSAWNPDDHNRRLMFAVTTSDHSFARAQDIARSAVVGHLSDRTNGADHFHTTAMNPRPLWARNRRPVKTIGRHVFYRLEIRGPR